jgi:predicted secreted protein
MRSVLLLVLVLLAACTESTASRVDDRTFRIQGPEMGMISDVPNQRVAARVCPKGYRVIDSTTHRGGVDRATDNTDPMTIWTIRCI